MDPNHLHLHVADPERSRAFYGRWFSLTEKLRHGEVVFLGSPGGFDLALAPAEHIEPMPRWFHLGFRLADPDAVRAMHAAMVDAGLAAGDLGVEPDFVWFRVGDPDDYTIEVYWEPQPATSSEARSSG